MLYLDQHFSVTLKRPLGISSIGDCPPPEPSTTDTLEIRLNELVREYTIIARKALRARGTTTDGKIAEFTKSLVGLLEKTPETLRFHDSWLQMDDSLPDWPLDLRSASRCFPTMPHVMIKY